MTWSEALEASIRIWRKRAKGIEIRECCPMCFKSKAECKNCPAKSTDICMKVVYEWDIHSRDTVESKRVAKQIVDALIKLRPKVRRSHKRK